MLPRAHLHGWDSVALGSLQGAGLPGSVLPISSCANASFKSGGECNLQVETVGPQGSCWALSFHSQGFLMNIFKQGMQGRLPHLRTPSRGSGKASLRTPSRTCREGPPPENKASLEASISEGSASELF